MRGSRSPARHTRILGVVLAIALALTGVAMIAVWLLLRPGPAPLPEAEFQLEPDRVAVANPATTTDPAAVLDTSYDHMVIASLNIDAPLDRADVTNGLLDLPESVSHTALWNGSAPIRSRGGTILIAGHVDDAQGDHGSLYELARIQPGTLIELVVNGHRRAWTVTGLQVHPKDALPNDVWAGPHGERRLVVITCGGPIVKDAAGVGHYADNIVVTATPTSLPAAAGN